MSTLELNLPDELRDFVDTQASARGYSSAGDFVMAMLHALERRQAWEDIEPLVLEGLASPAREMSAEDWQELRDRIDQAAARNEQP